MLLLRMCNDRIGTKWNAERRIQILLNCKLNKSMQKELSS